MKPLVSRTSRAPVLPLLALGLVGYLNITNRCADGYCYTYGWPWVAYYGWSDAQLGIEFGEVAGRDPWVWSAVLANALACFAIVGAAFAIQFFWRRPRVG
jgi:hypothetical protein